MPAKRAGRRSRFVVQLDARTADMPMAALMCRSMNHPWEKLDLDPARKLELLRLGQTESIWRCFRCESVRTDLFELPSFATLSSKIAYSDDYLIKDKGTGRLPRLEAKKAMYCRDMPELLAAS